MLDNLQVLSPEEVTFLTRCERDLKELLEKTCSFIVTPKGKRKDRQEAIELLKKEISKNSQIEPILKAAYIANARKILKEYSNQNDIVTQAIEFLKPCANPKTVDIDWLNLFMDKARLISESELQLIFSHILAEECNSHGSVSKTTVHILSLMDKELAKAFSKLCRIKMVINIPGDKDKLICVLIPTTHKLHENPSSIQYAELVELESIGLIEVYKSEGYYTCKQGEYNFECGKNKGVIRSENEIPFGAVTLTRSGRELASIVDVEIDMDYYAETVKKYWERYHIEIQEE